MSELTITMVPVRALRPYDRNARTHSKKQLNQIAASIREFGFNSPVLISPDDEIIAGHGRVEAAKQLGLESVPAVRLPHLSAKQRRAFAIADNKIALNAGWDLDLLAIELKGLIDLDYDVSLTGFEIAEIDIVLDGAAEKAPEGPGPEDLAPEVDRSAPVVSRSGDVWILGEHPSRVRRRPGGGELPGSARGREGGPGILRSAI